MKAFLERHWQLAVNLFLAGCLIHYAVTKGLENWRTQQFSFVEVTFVLHNLFLLTSILVRQDHRALETRVGPQIVALAAFFSGIGFVQTPEGSPDRLLAANVVTVFALVFGMGALVSLRRSFGILIAVRTVRSSGLYGLIRHPMYLSDIIWRIGYILKNGCTQNLVLFFLSSACYVWRALLEERFLGQFPEYQEYRERVRYRFIPGIF